MQFAHLNKISSREMRVAVDAVLARFPSMDRRLLESAALCDPTADCRWLWWIARQLRKGRLALPDDSHMLSRRLRQFYELSDGLDARHADIARYADLGSLSRFLERNSPQTMELDEDLPVVAVFGEWQVLRLASATACRRALKGCDWPAAAHPARMLREGCLLLVVRRAERRALIHPPTAFARQLGNRPVQRGHVPWALVTLLGIDMPYRGELCGLLPLASEVTETEVLELDDPQLAAEWAVLHGKRCELLEALVARDVQQALIYAEAVTSANNRSADIERLLLDHPQAAVRYARSVLGGRWLEAEPVIAANHEAAVEYAVRVVRERWPEGETSIMRHAPSAMAYASGALHGKRLDPSQESALVALGGEPAVDYARFVLRAPYPIDADHRRMMRDAQYAECFGDTAAAAANDRRMPDAAA